MWLHRWVHNTSSRSDWYRTKGTQTLLPPSKCERWGILPNLLESQQTFSRCALPLPASCLIKHVESCSLKASCLFFWRSLPSLPELCNSKWLTEERRSINVDLNPLKSDTNTDSVWAMEVSLIDWFFYHDQLVPIDLCCEMVLRKLDWDPSVVHKNWSLGIIKTSVKPWFHEKMDENFLISRLLLSSTHLEIDALHGHQLTFLTDAERVWPRPVGNGLCPDEVLPILDHLCYHFVVRLGTEESCYRGKMKHTHPFMACALRIKFVYRLLPKTPRNFPESPARISQWTTWW